MFTGPEITTVGLTEAEAKEAGFDRLIGEMPLRSSGRALTRNENGDFVRIISETEAEFALGARSSAPRPASSSRRSVSPSKWVRALMTSPAQSYPRDSLRSRLEAAENAYDESIHMLNR